MIPSLYHKNFCTPKLPIAPLWGSYVRLMGESLKRQDWRTCSGKLRDFNGLLGAALGRKQNASVNAPLKNLAEVMSCQSENNKVFLAVANGDQKLAQGLCRLVSPRLMGDAAYQSVFTEWVDLVKLKEELKEELNALIQAVGGLWEKNGGSSKRKQDAIGAPPPKRWKF